MPTSQLTSLPEAADRTGSQPKKPVSRFALACTVGALLTFAGLDAANRFFVPADRYATAGRSWIWWAVHDFRARKVKPDTVLLGSSLMMAAQNDGDATFLNKTLDALLHWRSQYFEYKLQSMLGKTVTTGSFVIGGEMASDAYAIFSTMLEGHAAPKTVIWGIAPRDFVDSTFPAPEESPVVQYMSQISGDNDLLKTGKMPLWMRLDNALSSLSSIYARRAQYFWAAQETLSHGLSSYLPNPSKNRLARSPELLPHFAKGYLADDNAPGEWTTKPYGQKPMTNSDNSVEYRQRYQPFKSAVLQTQLSFARKVLLLAQKQGTDVILVNMPLQRKNMDLLPAGVYSIYLKEVESVARAGNAQFIDLNNQELFKGSDFADPVHLNGIGALKFFNYLSEHWPKP
jgi:Protein of unknown function (DUF1574)